MRTPLNDVLFSLIKKKIDSENKDMAQADEKVLGYFHKAVAPRVANRLSEELYDWVENPPLLKSEFESERIHVFETGLDSDIQKLLPLSRLSKEKGQHLFFSSSTYPLPSDSFVLSLLRPLIDFLEAQCFKKWRIIFKNHADPMKIYFQIDIELDLEGIEQ